MNHLTYVYNNKWHCYDLAVEHVSEIGNDVATNAKMVASAILEFSRIVLTVHHFTDLHHIGGNSKGLYTYHYSIYTTSSILQSVMCFAVSLHTRTVKSSELFSRQWHTLALTLHFRSRAEPVSGEYKMLKPSSEFIESEMNSTNNVCWEDVKTGAVCNVVISQPCSMPSSGACTLSPS